MPDERNRKRHGDGLIFFGRITASVSHEINNVFAIVNELGGLLEDIVYGTKQGKTLEPEKVQRISEGVQKQIRRGKEIVQRLNRFAHSVDDDVSDFEISVVLRDVVDMAGRLAQLKRIELEADLSPSSIHVTNSRFFFQHAVFSGIETAFRLTGEGGKVRVEYSGEDNPWEIYIFACGVTKDEDVSREISTLSEAAESIGGTAELIGHENGDRVLKMTVSSF